MAQLKIPKFKSQSQNSKSQSNPNFPQVHKHELWFVQQRRDASCLSVSLSVLLDSMSSMFVWLSSQLQQQSLNTCHTDAVPAFTHQPTWYTEQSLNTCDWNLDRDCHLPITSLHWTTLAGPMDHAMASHNVTWAVHLTYCDILLVICWVQVDLLCQVSLVIARWFELHDVTGWLKSGTVIKSEGSKRGVGRGWDGSSRSTVEWWHTWWFVQRWLTGPVSQPVCFTWTMTIRLMCGACVVWVWIRGDV